MNEGAVDGIGYLFFFSGLWMDGIQNFISVS
jgi:hypothetical protein